MADVAGTLESLDALFKRLQAGALKGTGEIAEQLQSDARVFAPREHGTLAESIHIDGPREAELVSNLPRSAPRGPYVYAARVGPTVVYGRMREWGGRIPSLAAPGGGYVRRDNGGLWLAWGWNGRMVFRRKSIGVKQHGNAYLYKARESTFPQARGLMSRRIAEAIGG